MQDPIYNEIVNKPRPSLFAASGLVLLAAVGLWVVSLAEVALGAADSALMNAAYYLPFLLLPVVLCLRRGRLGEAMRLNPLPLMPALTVSLLALLSVFVASALSAAWQAGLGALGLRGGVPTVVPEDELSLAVSILGMAALPAVCEELLFRGFVFSAWESRGTAFAIAVSSALFALLHGNLFGMPAYLLVGAVAAFVTFALDSLYAGIVYHTVYNAACLIIPWLVAGDAGEAALTAPMLARLALETLTLLAMMAMLLMSLRLRAHRNGVLAVPRVRRPLERRDRAMLAATLAELLVALVIVTAMSMAAGGGA